MVKRYVIFEEVGHKKIIAKRNEKNSEIRYLVHYNVFDAIERCHRNIGHKGCDAMHQKCKKKTFKFDYRTS